MAKRSPKNVADAVNAIVDSVNEVLQAKKTERYFESMVVLYSLIEDVLRWMVFLKMTWDRSSRHIRDDELKEITGFARDLNFFNAIRVAVALDIIDVPLKRRIDEIRRERNDILHQAWLYDKRSDGRVLRKKLEKVANTVNGLIDSVNELMEEVGVDEAFEAFP